MNGITWTTLLLLVCMCSKNVRSVENEFHIQDGAIPSYLEAIVKDVKDEIFPSNVTVNLAMSKIAGIFLYSLDSRGNQLIIGFASGQKPIVMVQLRGKEETYSMQKLCICQICTYTNLSISISASKTHIFLTCNNGPSERIEIPQNNNFNEDYPRVPVEKNSARLWMINVPNDNKPLPVPQQLQGCIFSLNYKGLPVPMKSKGSAITHRCKKSCVQDVCNGGICFETYETQPLCDCTNVFGSGSLCRDESAQINKKFRQQFQFSKIKLSWRSATGTIWQLGNSNWRMSLSVEGMTVYLIVEGFRNSQSRNVTLLDSYQMYKNYILYITFGQTIRAEISNGVKQIESNADLRSEVFDYLVLSSKSGVIDMVCKTEESQVLWERYPFDEATSENYPAAENKNSAFEVGTGEIPSYLFKYFPFVAEKVFPSDIRINISVTKMAGILLYSWDANGNQLILSMSNGRNPQLNVQFRGQDKTVQMKTLCGCSTCLYAPLSITVRMSNKEMKLICNGLLYPLIEFDDGNNPNKDYPMPDLKKNTARLWLINVPVNNKNELPNSEQGQGCIFSVEYNGLQVSMTKYGNAIRPNCKKACLNPKCNEGTCYETYSDEPVCDCTKVFGSGQYCKDESKRINKNFTQQFQFSVIKLSWRSDSPFILEIGNKNVKINLKEENRDLCFIMRPTSQDASQECVISNYEKLKKYVLILDLGNSVDLQVVNGKNASITSSSNVGKEIFEYLSLQSGTGEIDMVYKTWKDQLFWERWALEDIPRETDIGAAQGNPQTKNMNNQPKQSNYVEKASVRQEKSEFNYATAFWVLLSLLVVIIVLNSFAFCWIWMNGNKIPENKYEKLLNCRT